MGCAARAPEANAQLMLIVRIVFNTLSQNTGRAAGCHLAEGVAIRLPRAEERALPASPVAQASRPEHTERRWSPVAAPAQLLPEDSRGWRDALRGGAHPRRE